MWLLISAGVVMVVSFIVAFVLFIKDYETEVPIGIAFISAAVLVIGLIFIPISINGDRNKVAEYNATKQTIEYARSNDVSDVEQAALITKIIEVNNGLAKAKLWNETTWGIYWLDEYANLEPLK